MQSKDQKEAARLRVMAGMERRLRRLSAMDAAACGYEENVEQASRYYVKIMGWLEGQLEQLQGGGK